MLKSLHRTTDGRTIVQTTPAIRVFPPLKNKQTKKEPVIVYCPCCGAEFLYSQICKQFTYKTKYNRTVLREIITREQKLRTGELAREYQNQTQQPISIRMLNYILKEFRQEGFIATKVKSLGRDGRTTIISVAVKRSEHI